MNVADFFDTARADRTTDSAARYIKMYFNNSEIMDKSVLDAGCGTGADSRAFAVKGAATVTGIDLSPESIKTAVEKAGQQGISNVQFLVADIGEYFRNHTGADIVFCQGSLPYLPDALGMLDLMAQGIAKGGILFFTLAARSFLGIAVNAFRKTLAQLPAPARRLIMPLLLAVVAFVHRFAGTGLKERGIKPAQGIIINLFMPLSSLVDKEEIQTLLKRRGFRIERFENHRMLGNDIFYLVKAVSQTP